MNVALLAALEDGVPGGGGATARSLSSDFFQGYTQMHADENPLGLSVCIGVHP